LDINALLPKEYKTTMGGRWKQMTLQSYVVRIII